MKYVLGIDFGGGASKATLLGEDGRIAATNTVEYPTLYPQSGYAEQNPEDWYQATRQNIRHVLEKSGVSAADIAALSLDAATHTAVLMDRDFRVLRPAIYWTDIRCAQEAEQLRKKHDELILEQALHKADTIWTLPQLMWVKENEPEIWGKTRHILFAKDYVRHQLTGDNVTDVIEAQGSMLFDYNTMEWSRELCSLLDLDMAVLPQLTRPDAQVGMITAQAAADTGLQQGTPVLCGTTDTAMEVFAAGAIQSGQMTVKLATAGRICVVTPQPYRNQHVINYSHIIDGLWYPGTATKSCAASYRWYRDTFGGDYRDLDQAAAQVPPGCDGLMFHPYLNGELTPYADPNLRGSFIGIRAGHTKAHFSRAVLEGVALSMLDCRKAMDAMGIQHNNRAAVIGGGAASPLWRQILADALDLTLVQKENSDSSLGSAMLAGVAAGFFASPQAALDQCTRDRAVTTPNGEMNRLYEERSTVYRAVHDALAPLYNQ